MATIEVIRDGAVARVWLNRPEQHNALAASLDAPIPEMRFGVFRM